jgi:hypothetical protein
MPSHSCSACHKNHSQTYMFKLKCSNDCPFFYLHFECYGKIYYHDLTCNIKCKNCNIPIDIDGSVCDKCSNPIINSRTHCYTETINGCPNPEEEHDICFECWNEPEKPFLCGNTIENLTRLEEVRIIIHEKQLEMTCCFLCRRFTAEMLSHCYKIGLHLTWRILDNTFRPNLHGNYNLFSNDEIYNVFEVDDTSTYSFSNTLYQDDYVN